MDLPERRQRITIEHVIKVGDGIDSKQFAFSYREVHERMRQEGVDMNYDDAYIVTVSDGEVIFSHDAK